jgi:hypothetical protein
LFDTDVLYSPKDLPGYNKAQAESLLRGVCQLDEERSRSPD